jgi:hypothetical protein
MEPGEQATYVVCGHTHVTVRHRGHDLQAINPLTRHWDRGSTVRKAIENLVLTAPEDFSPSGETISIRLAA